MAGIFDVGNKMREIRGFFFKGFCFRSWVFGVRISFSKFLMVLGVVVILGDFFGLIFF